MTISVLKFLLCCLGLVGLASAQRLTVVSPRQLPPAYHFFGTSFKGVVEVGSVLAQETLKWPYGCKYGMVKWDAFARGGPATFDIRKRANGTGDPTAADSIVGTTPPSVPVGSTEAWALIDPTQWNASMRDDDIITIVLTANSPTTTYASLILACQ